MSDMEPESLNELAGEYALGTLDAGERADVDRLRLTNPDLDAAIRDWEIRLAPLLDQVGEAVPSPDLLARIQARLPADDTDSRNVVHLHRRVGSWRRSAITAWAVAAGLAAFVIYGEATRIPVDQQFVAVFQEGDQAPSFLLSVNLETRELTIRPVAAKPAENKAFQLWMIADGLGEGPQSLGLLSGPENPTRKRLPELTRESIMAATFGISIEPPGGSPTGKPTGPALHGHLLPAAN